MIVMIFCDCDFFVISLNWINSYGAKNGCEKKVKGLNNVVYYKVRFFFVKTFDFRNSILTRILDKYEDLSLDHAVNKTPSLLQEPVR